MEPPVHASSSRRASSKLECEAAASKASFSLRESCLKAYFRVHGIVFGSELGIGEQAHGQPRTGVLRALAGVVHCQPRLHIHGIARVQ